jgi:hypothetical protein
MKDIRCLVGVHAWSTHLPGDVVTRHGSVALACRRCGRLKYVDDRRFDGALGRYFDVP